MRRPTVLIADGDQRTADALAALLAERSDIVGAVEDGLALVEAAERARPDVIVSDIDLPFFSALEALARLRERGVRSRFVVLTMNREEGLAAVRAGASAFVLKHTAGEDLVNAIDTVLNGRRLSHQP